LLSAHGRPDPNVVASTLQELEANVPNGGEPLAVQAQSANLCLMTAFQILADTGQATVVDAANAIIDAADNYEFFVRRRLKNDTQSPTDYPLLTREIDRQLADAVFVRGYERLPPLALVEHRIENLQYVIPPAV